MLKDALQKYRCVYRCPFWELPTYFVQGGCDEEIGIDFMLLDGSFNVGCELESQTSDYYSLGNNFTTKTKKTSVPQLTP